MKIANQLFANYLDDKEIEMLFTFSKKVKFQKDEEINLYSALLKGIYLVLEGTILLKAKLLQSNESLIESLQVGDYFGEVEYYNLSPWDTSYIAEQTTLCLFIPADYLALIANMYPGVKYKIDNEIAKQMINRIYDIEKKIFESSNHFNPAIGSFWGMIQATTELPERLQLSDRDIHMIEKLPILACFDTRQKRELIHHSELIHIPKYYPIIQENDCSAVFYITLKGAVQANFNIQAEIAKLVVFGPNNLFANFLCLNTNMPSKLSFIACEHVLLLEFSQAAITGLQQGTLVWSRLFNLFLQTIVELKNALYKLYVRSHIEIHYW